MTLSPDSLKEFLEITFSMPFDVRTENRDGAEIFISCPRNDGFLFFDVVTYISNSIRIVVEIKPQRHAGGLVHDWRCLYRFENARPLHPSMDTGRFSLLAGAGGGYPVSE